MVRCGRKLVTTSMDSTVRVFNLAFNLMKINKKKEKPKLGSDEEIEAAVNSDENPYEREFKPPVPQGFGQKKDGSNVTPKATPKTKKPRRDPYELEHKIINNPLLNLT